MDIEMEENKLDDSNLENVTLHNEVDISQLCRVCANPNEYLIPIFQDEGLEHDLKSKISKHLPIKVAESDNLPIQLCYQCASTLIAWHDLVIGCLEADEKLRSLFVEDELENDKKDVGRSREKKQEGNVSIQLSTVESSSDIVSIAVPQPVEILKRRQNLTHQNCLDSLTETEQIIEEKFRPLQPEFTDLTSDSRFITEEDDYNGDIRVNGNEMKMELEDDLFSGYESESDEEFTTLYSCNICAASNMESGEFMKHTKTHTKEERQMALQELVENKLLEESAARNAAAAYGFRAQLNLTSSVPLYLCTVCGQGNLMLKNLNEHSSLHPRYTESHFCNLCQQQFHDSSTLVTHLETHLDNNDLFCQYCYRKFSNIEDLEIHENNHYRAEFICFGCCQNFASRELIKLHIKESHSEGTICYICDHDFKVNKLFEKHYMTHVSVSIVKKQFNCFSCEICYKKWDSKVSLQRHILFLHNDRMPFICKHCGFTAYHKDSLVEHVSKEHQNSYKCGICNISFSRKKDFNVHTKTHTSTNVYHCKLCSNQFTKLKHLRSHLKLHSRQQNLDTVDFTVLPTVLGESVTGFEHSQQVGSCEQTVVFSCLECGESFQVEDNYNEHLKSHAAVACHLCEKSFEDESDLNRHLNKVHSNTFFKRDNLNYVNSFPFSCEKCAVTFKLEFKLEEHECFDSVVYQCHLCYEEFTNDCDFQTHLDLHETETNDV